MNKNLIKQIILIYLISVSLTIGRADAAKNIVFFGKERKDYITDVLRMALKYTPENKYRLVFYGHDLPKLRSFQEVSVTEKIDMLSGGITLLREEKLRSIRIPLLMGLHGWRIPLVKSDNREIFSGVKTLQEFKQFTSGQLHSWSDTAVLESNHIHVVKATSYQGLFEMLKHSRFDYFPRSVIEVKYEYEQRASEGIVIEPNILINYPTAYHFYVNKKNEELALDIELALEKAIADGSFKRLFMSYYSGIINRVRKEKRKIFYLKNPLLNNNKQLQRKDFWIDLSR